MFIYLQKNIIVAFILGIISGLPFALTGSTLTLMLYNQNISIATIGMFSIIALPYTLKFLWSPLLDNLEIKTFSKLFGKRKVQLVIFSLALNLIIITLGFGANEGIFQIKYIAILALMLTTLSASNDVITDAMRIEVLNDNEQAAGLSMATAGYRIGMIISSAGALSISHFFNWFISYLTVAIILSALVTITLCLYKETHIKSSPNITNNKLFNIFVRPFKDLYKRIHLFYTIGFIIFFKMSDALIMALTSVFLIEVGYTALDIAFAVKTFGIAAAMLGSFIGGYFATKLDYKKFLVISLMLQMLSNLSYIILSYAQGSIYALFFVSSIEFICSGISTTALVSYISRLCNKEFTASQYALLSALASFARSSVTAFTGIIVESFGWNIFFIVTALASLPSLFFLNKACDFKKKY